MDREERGGTKKAVQIKCVSKKQGEIQVERGRVYVVFELCICVRKHYMTRA
jgi:hypothetical protein